MTEKTSTDIADISHDEKLADQALQPELADENGRRKSVALNIVENPLKVSFTVSGASPSSTILSDIDTDALFSRSVAPQSRPLPTPGPLLSPMAWPSTPICLVELL